MVDEHLLQIVEFEGGRVFFQIVDYVLAGHRNNTHAQLIQVAYVILFLLELSKSQLVSLTEVLCGALGKRVVDLH